MTPEGRVRFSKKSCKPPRKFCGEFTESTEEHHLARARMVRKAYGGEALDALLSDVEQRGILELIVLDPANSRREARSRESGERGNRQREDTREVPALRGVSCCAKRGGDRHTLCEVKCHASP